MYGGIVLNSLNSGQRGCDLADWLVQGFGVGTHVLIAQHGETALVQAMAGVPGLAFFGETRLRKFAHEFINYDEILSREDGGADEEDEAEMAAAPRRA